MPKLLPRCLATPTFVAGRVLKALEGLSNLDLGGVHVRFGPDSRIGSRFVEVTVIGNSGKLLK